MPKDIQKIILEEEEENRKKSYISFILKRLFLFLLSLLLLLIPLYFLFYKLKYYLITYFLLMLGVFIFFIFEIFLKNKVKKEILLSLPLLLSLPFIFQLVIFNYFYIYELIFLFTVIFFSILILYLSYLKNFKLRKLSFSFIVIFFFLFFLVFLLNFVPSYLLFKKGNYYSFVYLPWNSIKLEITYTWKQPIVGVKWEDKILENGSIIKVSVPYVKDYILHEIKEVVRYNFFTRDYLVKVEGLKNESNWLVMTPYYQYNRSVSNLFNCYFEIGEAPHRPVIFYEKELLNFLETKNKKYFEQLYPFTQIKNKRERFYLNDWKELKPFEVIYLFKPYFVPRGSEFGKNKGLCSKFSKDKVIEEVIFRFKKDKKGE